MMQRTKQTNDVRKTIYFVVMVTAVWLLYSATETSLRYNVWNLSSSDIRPYLASVPLPLNISAERSEVLLCTYMRSGSSYVGQILGWRPDSFYLYEPLWKMYTWQYMREGGQMCDYTRPSCRKTGPKAVERTLTFLSDIYKCDFAKHYDKIKEGIHAGSLYSGPSWELFRKCRNQINLRDCLLVQEAVCRHATNKVTKVLRLDVSLSARLLDKHPRLKVVLLLRDPRGIINSHINTDWYKIKIDQNTLRKDIEGLCSRMTRDIAAVKVLQRKYGDRVKIIQYEDFDDPMEKALSLYRHIGMDISKNVTNLLHNLTRSKTDTKLQNQQKLFAYRNTMDWSTVEIMQHYCLDVYRTLGVTVYADKGQFTNLDISAAKSPLPFSLH